MTSYWWVNQNKTMRAGLGYETVWAPVNGSNGKPRSQWARLLQASSGDQLLHYRSGTGVVGTSTVTSPASTQSTPFGSGDYEEEGRLLPVNFVEFESPLALSSIPLEMRLSHTLPAPFNVNGTGVQEFFLPLDPEIYRYVCELSGIETADQVQGEANTSHPVPTGPTDVLTQINRRREQRWLRGNLLGGRREASCDVCDTVFPSSYLRAAHIKPRNICSDEERVDPQIAMLACTFGCDEAFERGALSVDENGLIYLAGDVHPGVKKNLQHLVGKKVSIFSGRNAQYFEARRQDGVS